MKSVPPVRMRRIDDVAINGYGIASLTLMENAGSVVAEAAKKLLGRAKGKRVCAVCGKGNNGGDGLAASRHLINSGFEVDAYILAGSASLRGDPGFNLELLKHSGCTVEEIIDAGGADKFIRKFNYSLIVDAIFGTGFSGLQVSEPARTIISFLNSANCKIVSVDIPSGLDGYSGKVGDVAVQADVTVTLGLPKRGFFLHDGPRHTGKLIVRNIGFPKPLLC